MSYNNNQLQQNSYGNHSSRTNDKSSSIESLFQGLIPGSNSADNNSMSMFPSSSSAGAAGSNNLNLNSLDTMGMSRFQQGASSSSGVDDPTRNMNMGLNMSGSLNDDRKRLQQLQQLQHQQQSNQQQFMGNNNAGRQGNPNNNLGDELKRLQQLHQLTSTQNTANHSQLMQGLFGNPPSQPPSLALNSFNQGLNVGGLSQRDAAAYLLMNQQHQQQRTLQQQLQGTAGLGSSSVAARLAAAKMALPSPSMLAARTSAANTTGLVHPSRGGPGAIEPFPEKLHRMLLEVEATGRGDIISFVDDGRAFAIHKPTEFFKSIVPLYFRQSRLSSFKRQLNLYGFELISNGPSRGAYFHELFQRDKPSLCRRMRRVAVKVSAKKKEEEEGQEGAGPAAAAKGEAEKVDGDSAKPSE